MAFSDSDKNKIRFYLGWGSRFQSTDSTLESAMDTVGGDSDAVSLIASTLITDLDDVYAKLKTAHTALRADKVGSLELPKGKETMMLRTEGARLAGAVASHLGVFVDHDVFSASSPRGYAQGSPRMGSPNRIRYG